MKLKNLLKTLAQLEIVCGVAESSLGFSVPRNCFKNEISKLKFENILTIEIVIKLCENIFLYDDAVEWRMLPHIFVCAGHFGFPPATARESLAPWEACNRSASGVGSLDGAAELPGVTPASSGSSSKSYKSNQNVGTSDRSLSSVIAANFRLWMSRCASGSS